MPAVAPSPHLVFTGNPGLRSRFDEVVAFPDYRDDELFDIFEVLISEHQFTLTPGARTSVVAANAAMPRDRSFANARSLRNLFNQVIARHACGLAAGTFRGDVMNVIEPWAVPAVAVTRPEAGDHHGGYL